MHTWKNVLALLLNDTTREVFANLLLGKNLDEALAGLAASKQQRIREALSKAQVVDPLTGEFTPQHIQQLLAAAKEEREPFYPFMNGGKLVRYPVAHERRAQLLRHLAERVLKPGEIVAESELNTRLADFTSAFAEMRRYMIDYGVLLRHRDGTGYWLNPDF